MWLVDPSRQLLKVLGSDYLERFVYRTDEVLEMARDLAGVLSSRLPEKGLSVEESLARRWSGPEIFLIIDNSERLPAGIDAPLRDLAAAANAASDVGLRVVYTRRFGGWSSSMRADPLMTTMLQANANLLVMDSDPDEGYIRARWRGHPMPTGRGFLMGTAGSGKYVQVGWVSADHESR